MAEPVQPQAGRLITDLIGKDYIYDADKLQGLRKYTEDAAVLQKLQEIKQANKERLAKYLKKTQGDIVDPSTLFDVQVKRLHEYKRQHMNALNILATYQWLRENPNADFVPHTFFFGLRPPRATTLPSRSSNLSPPWPRPSTAMNG